MSKPADTVDRVEAEVTDPLRTLGLDVEAVELTPAGKRRVLRVAVDKDGGVTMDDVAEATRAIDEVLEASSVMGEHPFTLEVTSRGVDRPLTAPRHWRRNLDRLVKITSPDGTARTGRILTAEEDPGGAVSVEVDGEHVTVAYAEIDKALIQIEFRPRATPGADPSDDEKEHD